MTVVPVDTTSGRASAHALVEALGADVALVVVSAPSYPHGVIDAVAAVAGAAADRGIPCHVDACVGGWVLPYWEESGGESLPRWDFRVRGVSSISADIHKYGYVPKGASLLLFADGELDLARYFAITDWLGYPVVNPTMLGTRSATSLAAAWAVVQTLGDRGVCRPHPSRRHCHVRRGRGRARHRRAARAGQAAGPTRRGGDGRRGRPRAPGGPVALDGRRGPARVRPPGAAGHDPVRRHPGPAHGSPDDHARDRGAARGVGFPRSSERRTKSGGRLCRAGKRCRAAAYRIRLLSRTVPGREGTSTSRPSSRSSRRCPARTLPFSCRPSSRDSLRLADADA